MKYENLEILKKVSPNIYSLCKRVVVDDYKTFGFDKKGKDVNLYTKTPQKVYINSVNNKEKESKLIVDDILSGDYDEMLIIGFGNATVLKELLNRVDSKIKLYVIEFKEVFDILLNQESVKKIKFNKIDNFTLIDINYDLRAILYKMFTKSNMNLKIFVLPQYKRLFEKQVENFYKSIKEVVASKKSNITTNQGYQKLWIYNSIINFKHVISTPNFMDLKKNDFSNSMALIVGAGPSLNFEIERLKEISKNKSCYIFAIGSAYKALIKHNINIDAIFSYDPTPLNADVMAEYHEKKLNVPVCFGSSISFEAIRQVDYKKAFHLIISQDYFGQYLLEDEKRTVVSDAPSVVVIAIQALAEIGFKNIAFIGQNMAYLDGKNYSTGIEYDRLKDTKYNSDLLIKDVFGNEVSTMSGYVLTRDIIEKVIKQIHTVKFTNTTYGGAHIEGAPYLPLNELELENYDMSKLLTDICSENDYDLKRAKDKFNRLADERIKFNDLLEQGFKGILEIKEMLEGNSVRDAYLIVSLQEIYNEMCKNDYFKVIISKLDRNYINFFESGIVEINREKSLKIKYEMLFKKMGTLFSLFKKDDAKVNELFAYILKWINWE